MTVDSGLVVNGDGNGTPDPSLGSNDARSSAAFVGSKMPTPLSGSQRENQLGTDVLYSLDCSREQKSGTDYGCFGFPVEQNVGQHVADERVSTMKKVGMKPQSSSAISGTVKGGLNTGYPDPVPGNNGGRVLGFSDSTKASMLGLFEKKPRRWCRKMGWRGRHLLLTKRWSAWIRRSPGSELPAPRSMRQTQFRLPMMAPLTL